MRILVSHGRQMPMVVPNDATIILSEGSYITEVDTAQRTFATSETVVTVSRSHLYEAVRDAERMDPESYRDGKSISIAAHTRFIHNLLEKLGL